MLPDGRYAVPYSDSHRLIKVQTITAPGRTFGRRVLFYKKERGWEDFAFLNEDNSIHLYVKMKITWTEEQKEVVQSAVKALIRDPQKAKELYIEISQAEAAEADNVGNKYRQHSAGKL